VKKLLLATVFMTGVSPAIAADLPVKVAPYAGQAYPSYWDGFYLGVNGGYGTGSIDAFGFSSPTATGFLGGIQAGANKQVGNIVFGMVTDIDAGSIEKSGNKLGWLGTTRGKLGFLVTPTVLFYGTGGVAYGGINLGTISDVDLTGFKTPTVGWTGGAGVEVALSPNWGLGAEYLHVNLSGMSGPGFDSKAEGDIFRGVLNYKF
jgi:outer membrane immunogenic protein